MRAGRLDRRITIQAVTRSRDSFGQASETWADLLTVWAAFKPVSASERFAAAQTIATQAATFSIRYRADLSLSPGGHRIRFDGKNWNITGYSEIGRREGWEIYASAGQ